MKATILKSAVLVAVLFAAVLNSNVSAGNKFYSNDEMEGNLIIAKTIYVNDGQLHNHMKYNYTYDADSRMTSKEVLKWNERTQSWAPTYKLDYSYTENAMTILFVAWNAKANEYNLEKQKVVYELDTINQPISYLSYKWDSKNQNWNEMNEISYGHNKLLAAER